MLEFSNENIVGFYLFPATESDIENIMVTAIEGGTGHWGVLDNTTKEFNEKPKNEPQSIWATKILLDGDTLNFIDIETQEVFKLTLEMLLKGVSLNQRYRPYDADLETMDSEMADCIIQYALFSDVVYG